MSQRRSSRSKKEPERLGELAKEDEIQKNLSSLQTDLSDSDNENSDTDDEDYHDPSSAKKPALPTEVTQPQVEKVPADEDAKAEEIQHIAGIEPVAASGEVNPDIKNHLVNDNKPVDENEAELDLLLPATPTFQLDRESRSKPDLLRLPIYPGNVSNGESELNSPQPETPITAVEVKTQNHLQPVNFTFMTIEPDAEGEDVKEKLGYEGKAGVPAVGTSICIDVESEGELSGEPSSIEIEQDFPEESLIASSALSNTTGSRGNTVETSESVITADEQRKNEDINLDIPGAMKSTDDKLPVKPQGKSSQKDCPSLIKGLVFRNIPSLVTKNDLLQTLGINTAKYTETLISCKIFCDSGEGLPTIQCAIITAPSEMIAEIAKLDKIEVDNHTIEISTTPLTFFRIKFDVPLNSVENNLTKMEDTILYFIFEDEIMKSISNCVVLETEQTTKGTIVHAIIATPAVTPNPSSEVGEFLQKITDKEFHDLLQEKAKAMHNETVSVRRRGDEKNDQLMETEDMDFVTQEIRKYDMDICKQMKRKLLFIDRKNFEVRNDKGSSGREQLYVDCSTSMYEFFRFHLITVLKSKMKCTEDLSRRKICTDANSNKRSEVEAQYAIEFEHDGIKHNIHITFYYTKCSLWLQGLSTKINNLTVAQFFANSILRRYPSS